jgi:hypothetical protein
MMGGLFACVGFCVAQLPCGRIAACDGLTWNEQLKKC